MFAGIEQFADQFSFGIQTNATLLDDQALAFIKRHEISVGISLDAHQAANANKTRRNWHGKGYFDKLVSVLEKLAGYPGVFTGGHYRGNIITGMACFPGSQVAVVEIQISNQGAVV